MELGLARDNVEKQFITEYFPLVWFQLRFPSGPSHLWNIVLQGTMLKCYFLSRVLDNFLLSGFNCVFQVALAILKVSRKDLLSLDFEGMMKYFRVNVPKRFRYE